MPDDPDLFGSAPPAAATVTLPDLPPVQHAGERVLTTEWLARSFGVVPDNIHDNYADNRERFEEGTHYHRLVGEDLRAFKNCPATSGLVGKRAPHLFLWTARGAAHHAKMINSDEAWAVYEKLASAYFDGPRALVRDEVSDNPGPRRVSPTGRAVVADFKAFASLGPLLGYDTNQAALAANRAVRHFRGIDLLAALGATHLVAPQQEVLLRVTDLGQKVGGLTAKATNLLLTKHGFQVASRDADGDLQYEATDLGRPHSRMMDVDIDKPGTSKQQLRWLTSVIEPLRIAIGREDAA